jgi:hypothetical protein
LAEQFVQVVAETEGSQREEYFYSLRYQAGTWKRGTMENFINEAKNGFFFDKTDSFHFLENAVRMMVSWLSYHINNFMRALAFPEKAKGLQILTIRLRFFKTAGKLIHSGRRMMLRLSAHHVYQDEFFHILRQIQSLSW